MSDSSNILSSQVRYITLQPNSTTTLAENFGNGNLTDATIYIQRNLELPAQSTNNKNTVAISYVNWQTGGTQSTLYLNSVNFIKL